MNPYLRLQLMVRTTGRDRSSLTAPRLRRVLGKALIDRFCAYGEPLCQARPARGGHPIDPREACALAEACPYGVLFAASRSPRPPFALYVPGDCALPQVPIEVTLYGPAWNLYPWVIAAIERALGQGLGKARTRWEVGEVFRVRPDRSLERLAHAGGHTTPPTVAPDHFSLALDPAAAPVPVSIDLLSPARLLRDGRMIGGREPVPFEVLVARIFDRFRGLYGDGASELVRPEVRTKIEGQAAETPLLSDETRWLEVRDYSARSGKEMLMGGKVGRLTYGEGAVNLLPILRAGELLHLGKNVAAGCGRISVDAA